MTTMLRVLRTLRSLILGSKLQKTADRHHEAADRLDAALRKVLRK